MAKFTAAVDIDLLIPSLQITAAAGQTARIPDAMVADFATSIAPNIPGFAWVTQDETSAIPSLPIAESDVTGLTADLAAKAASVHTHAESQVTSLTTDLGLKFDKAGGIISGATTVTGTLTGGKYVLNGGGFTNTFDTDLWIAPANRSNPANLAQAIYAQLRVSGSMASQVMDAAAFEIRLNSISNATYLNAIETSVVITGGVNAIADTRALTANLTFSGTPTGTITAAKLIVAQTIANSTSATIGTIYGVYVEPQTIGTTANWSLYAPTGTSLFGQVRIDQPAGTVNDLQFGSGTNLRWIVRRNTTAESGSNVGSDLEILARSDTGGAVGTALTIFRSTFGIQFGTGPLGFFGTTPVAKKTGWTAATNTKTRTTFDTTTVTTAVLAAHVGALIDDLLAYGLISA